jgi:hypothetical protein
MLILTDELLISKGGMRACYRHPQNELRCAKVYRQLSEIPRMSAAKNFRVLLGSRFDRFNMNVQEYRFWLRLQDDEKISSVLHHHIPHIDGLVQSNLGVALIEELYLDSDGEPSRNLKQLQGKLSQEQLLQIQNDLRVVTDCVIKHAIPIYDWNPTNILVLRKHDRCAVKIADLEGEFGNKEFIKISRWNTAVRRRKLRRRIDRFYAYFNNTILKQST